MKKSSCSKCFLGSINYYWSRLTGYLSAHARSHGNGTITWKIQSVCVRIHDCNRNRDYTRKVRRVLSWKLCSDAVEMRAWHSTVKHQELETISNVCENCGILASSWKRVYEEGKPTQNKFNNLINGGEPASIALRTDLEITKAERRICWTYQNEVYKSRSKLCRHLRKKYYPFDCWGSNGVFEIKDEGWAYYMYLEN
jgi:hypothetical protein